MMNKQQYTWQHGFTQRVLLNSDKVDTNRISECYTKQDQEAKEQNSLIEYSIGVVSRLNESTRIGKAKKEIVNSLRAIYLNNSEEQTRVEESIIRWQLMKQTPKDRNILSQYTRQQRIEFNARKNNLY